MGPPEASLVAELGDDHPEEAAAEAAGRGGLPAVAAADRSLAGGRLEDLVSSVRAVGVWPPRSVASAGAGRRQAHCRVLAVRGVPRSWSTGRGSAAGAAVSPVATVVFVATKFVQGRWLLL
jgi:hypothetical protein